ncbi:uncharacterized protein LOC132613053 [Lycium barbarum]|uniref:uncharacterized protein LOC132613053 n=1 Tax=Lycium barbarum TaxID=112863 RepID=UPI00293E73C1|nr:uncharacterized protein LOC132613053 [Lycium barbarum]
MENVLLTQEIIADIRLRTKPANVVMKLDMATTYDRVSWLFLLKVLRKFGFSEVLVDMIFRLVSNSYSVLINGQHQGFFQSSRGVKQRDPFSPNLSILSTEVLTRNINALHQIHQFKGYGFPKWSPKVNHLAYADDMIIFSSADVFSLQLVMEILKKYEKTSAQKINKEKSAVYMHKNVPGDVSITVEIVTGIGRKYFPFTYLGCPIYHSRRKKDFFTNILMKIMNRLQSWKGKLLSFGGRAILIKHVLQSMSIHLLSAVNAPIGVIRQIHKMFAQLFWSNTVGGKSRHWASWNRPCFPVMEGGMGFRSLHDVFVALICKLWWNLRTNHPYRGMGNSRFWFDNWTGMGALYYTVEGYDENVQNVANMVDQGQWNLERLRELLPDDIVQHSSNTIRPTMIEREMDRPWWILDTKGDFTIKSAWDYIRLRGQNMELTGLGPIVLQLQVPHKWEELIAMLESGGNRLKVKKVVWNLPPAGWLLCNTDGASRGNLGRSAYGFCLRNNEGNLVYAQAAEIDINTNTDAEVIAILEAMRYCRNERLDNVIIQTDSKMIYKILEEGWKPSWGIVSRIEEILELRSTMTISFSHSLREGNKLDDALANQALDEASFQCQDFQGLRWTKLNHHVQIHMEENMVVCSSYVYFFAGF